MNHTTQTYPRRMGERVRGAEYACALDTPRPGRIRNALCWLIGWGLIAAAVSMPYYW